jgi:hypothetical protein
LAFKDGSVFLMPTRILTSLEEVATVEGSTTLTYPRVLQLRVASRGIDAGVLQRFGLPSLPLPNKAAPGTWRGSVRLREGEWAPDVPGKQLK